MLSETSPFPAWMAIKSINDIDDNSNWQDNLNLSFKTIKAFFDCFNLKCILEEAWLLTMVLKSSCCQTELIYCLTTYCLNSYFRKVFSVKTKGKHGW